LLDVLVQQQAEDCGGEKGDEEIDEEGEPVVVFAEEAPEHLKDSGPVEAEDGEDGAALDDDVEVIDGAFVFGGIEAEDRGGENEVPGGGDGEKLRDALNQPE
jgi:hypothetical protein